MGNPLDYPTEVWRLFRETPRAGRFETGAGVVSAEAGTAAGKFRLRLECRIENDRVIDARFQAYGCPYTIAAGAWLAGSSIGRPQAELAQARTEELRTALEIPEDRAHCWLMAQDVLRELAHQSP
ncbi:MAG: iron-sulfur cluster assembly scaffold protein [Panacagrimonas sp.]